MLIKGARTKILARVLFDLAFGSRRLFIGIALGLVGLSLTQAMFFLLIRPMLQLLFQDPSKTAEKISIAQILPANLHWVAEWLPNLSASKADLAIQLPLLLLFVGIFRALSGYLFSLYQQAFALEVGAGFRNRIFAGILALPYLESKSRSAAEWMSAVMNDVHFLQNRMSEVLVSFVRGGALIVSGICAIFWLHPPSAIALAVIGPVAAMMMGRTGQRISKYAEHFQRELGRLAGAILDIRERFDFIRAQSGERIERARFDGLNRSYYETMRRSILMRSAFAPVLEFGGFAVFAGFLYLSQRRDLTLPFQDGEMVIEFFAALGILLKPLKEVGEQFARFQEARGALGTSMYILERQEGLRFEAARNFGLSALKENVDETGIFPKQLNMRKLSYIYDSGTTQSEPAFTGVDLKVESGKAVAVIGPSGGGKSTLIRILAGLIPPTHWECDVSWQEVSQWSSLVSQEPFLFRGSIQENLSYGLERALSENVKREALEAVDLWSEVESRPGGLKSSVAFGSTNLSGGQLQRMAIARAIMRPKSLWLFDEATAAIDGTTESLIIDHLIRVVRKEKKALIFVTHRLKWLSRFDDIWFVEGGRLTNRGSFESLQKDDRFRRFIAEQQQM